MKANRTYFVFGAFVALAAILVAAIVGCARSNYRPDAHSPKVMSLNGNTAPCYSGYCDANCPYRNNANYVGCGPSGTGPLCPSGHGICRGIVLEK